MGHKDVAQMLQKASILKSKIMFTSSETITSSEEWTDQKQLQLLYYRLLMYDLEYALDQKVEQDLWNICFKHFISILQKQTKTKVTAQRIESQKVLGSFLDSASGSYLTILQDLCWNFDLDVPFKKKNPVFNKINKYTEIKSFPQKSSCLYLAQYCLIHLGDLARYKFERNEAYRYYKNAISVSPHCGHPYNQLALLEASEGDRFSTVFQYVRSLSVKNPFPVAATNLTNMLTSAIYSTDNIVEIQTKMSVQEFTSLYLKAHGHLNRGTDLEQAELCVKSITSTLTALVATQSFTSEKLIKMTIINLNALKQTVGDNLINIENLSDDKKDVRALILELLAGSLSAFLLPVYTLKTDDSFLDYYALPAIKLIFMWVKNNPMILTDEVFNNRMQIWPSYCKLLNSLQAYIKHHDYTKYSKTPLSYDRDLQGFLPLHNTFKIYDYSLPVVDYSLEKQIRAYRLVEFGKWLTSYDVNGKKLIICNKSEDDEVLYFEPGCTQPDPTNKLLEEMESFKITSDNKIKGAEKRGGILKPQGSLEKSREERVTLQNNDINSSQMKKSDTKINKRVSQNVALQSIYRKLEENNKQVKFSAETNEKDKEKTSPKAKPQSQKTQLLNPASMNSTYAVEWNGSHQSSSTESSDYAPFSFALPNPNTDRNLPMYNSQSGKTPKVNVQYPMIPANNSFSSNFSNLIEKPMTFNVPPPPIYNYNKKEDGQQNTWWPNHLPTNPMMHSKLVSPGCPPMMGPIESSTNGLVQGNNLLTSNLCTNNNSSNIGMGVNQMGRNTPYQSSDYFKFNNQPLGATSNEMYNSPWNLSRTLGGYASSNNQALNMRQAMLNETKHPNSTGLSNTNFNNNAPGYSLFNTSTWAPALPGQLRNNSTSDMRQQSLLPGSSPQSLQQLLDQQKQLSKNDL